MSSLDVDAPCKSREDVANCGSVSTSAVRTELSNVSGGGSLSADAPSTPWRQLCELEWLLCAVVEFLEDGGDDLHSLWMLALDDGLTTLHTRLQQHGSLSVQHARRLAMALSSWSVLLKLSALAPLPKGQRLAKETVDAIEAELTLVGLSRDSNRRKALLTGVAVDHKPGVTRPEACPHCGNRFSHSCHGEFHRCTAPRPTDTQHFCRARSHCAMYAAARDGRLESVVWLHYVVCYDQEHALSLAARNGHVDTVDWLLDHAHGNNITVDFRYRDDEALGVMCWRTTPFSQNYTMTKKWGVDQALSNYVPECLAAKQGDIDGLQRLYANPFFRSGFTSRLAIYAVAHVTVLEFLIDLCPEIFENSSAMWYALRDGHLDAARLVVAQGFDTVDNPRYIRAGMLSNRLDVVQWMLAHTSDRQSMIRDIIAQSSECTSQPVLEWLVREHGLKLTTSTHALYAAARKETALVKWIVSVSTARRRISNGRALLEAAIKTDNLELAQWLVEELGVWSPEAFRLASVGRSNTMLAYMYEAAQSQPVSSPVRLVAKRRVQFDPNCLATVEWLLDHGFRSGLFESGALDAVLRVERDYSAAQHAIGTGSVTFRPQTMRRFRRCICRLVCEYDVEYLRRVQWLPMWAARHGFLDALTRLYDIDDRNKFNRKRLDKLISETAREKVVKWLLEQDSSLFSTLVVKWAVRHGKLGVLKWVFKSFLPLHGEKLDTEASLLVRKCVRTATWHAKSNTACGDADIPAILKYGAIGA